MDFTVKPEKTLKEEHQQEDGSGPSATFKCQNAKSTIQCLQSARNSQWKLPTSRKKKKKRKVQKRLRETIGWETGPVSKTLGEKKEK